MNLQAKLTLGNVVLGVLMVTIISAMDFVNNVQQQFDATLERAEIINPVATKFVRETRNSRPTVSMREALRDERLSKDLLDLVIDARALVEIAVVDPQTNEVLAGSDPTRLGQPAGPYPDFRELVKQGGSLDQLRIVLLHGRGPEYYQIERPLASGGQTVLQVRVIIAPALIRDDIKPILTKQAQVAVGTIAGAVCLTLLFSAFAFRPLGRLRRQLDLVTSGEYEPEKAVAAAAAKPAKPATDELSVMASKVSLLGQRLRGAQYEVSDLRGNIDRLLQDLEDAVFIFNRERSLVFASGAVEKFIGRDRGGLGGQPITEVFPPATPLGLLIAQASQTARPVRNRRVPLTAAGELPAGPAVVLLSVDTLETLPGGAGTGSGLLVRLRDPEAQRKIGRELQTADRLAAISRVSSGVAHEVKNPLNAILLHVEVAKARLARGDTDISQQMDTISAEILRLDRVVKTFLDFTRPVELKLSNVSLGEFVEDVVNLARPQAEASKIRIDVVQEADGVEIRVDRDLLKQALLNVVVNAIEAMPQGGELRFEAYAGEDTAEIRVSDTGVGIPPELREKIFRLYFTTRKEGSGIGLAMTFRIVQLHDGTIDFTSEPGKGTTFFIRLPIAV
jgi:signal transduction histidine kinase